MTEPRRQSLRERHRAWHERHGEWHERWHACGRRERRKRNWLRRKLFFALFLTIGITAGVVAGLAHLMGAPQELSREKVRARALGQSVFEAVLDDPAARARLAAQVAHDLDVGVRIQGAAGETLASVGQLDACAWQVDLPLSHGQVLLCAQRDVIPPWQRALLIIVPLAVLWGIAGAWARKFARPIAQMTDVARDLGTGKLDRRVTIHRHMHGEFCELAVAMNEMAERLEAKLRAERELLATVSHELRSPLARVRVLCELGAEGRREVVGEIEREAMHLDALVGDLLAAARIDGRATAPRAIDPVALAREAATRHAEVTGTEPVTVIADEAPAQAPLDATLVARALATLLDNAQRHAGGARRLRVGGADGALAFAVEDDGPGVTDGDLPRLFEPFQRGGGRTPDERDGVGLGLYLVRRVAEAHGGRAFAENLAPGPGARIGFTAATG